MKKVVFVLWFLIGFYGLFGQTSTKKSPTLNQNFGKDIVVGVFSDSVVLKFEGKLDSLSLFLYEKPDTTKKIKPKDFRNYFVQKSNRLDECRKFFGGWYIGDFKINELTITGLQPKKDYFLNIYKSKDTLFDFVMQIPFSTLAVEPTAQAGQIVFTNFSDTSISLQFIFGNGEGRMLVGAKGEEVDLPQDGKEYRASARFGSREAQLGKSFVLYDGKDKTPQVTVTNLEPGTKYTFAVFEYNGNGKYRNYNVKPSANNPRSKITRLKAPEILKVELIAPDGAFIRWKKVANGDTYILDVATDEDFHNKVDVYNEVDVGDLDTFELSDLVEGTTYYIRLKARGNGIESLYSKPVKFTISK
jgi:hypothetical protein